MCFDGLVGGSWRDEMYRSANVCRRPRRRGRVDHSRRARGGDRGGAGGVCRGVRGDGAVTARSGCALVAGGAVRGAEGRVD